MIPIIAIMVSFICITNVMAEQKLQPFTASYMVTSMGLEGIDVTNTLKLYSDKNQQHYYFKSYSIPVGLLALKKNETRNEQSKGKILNSLAHTRIQPTNYSYVQIRNGKIRRDVEMKFDWQKQFAQVHLKHKKKKWQKPIPSDSVDKLSYQLSLMLILADLSKNNQSIKEPFNLSIIDVGKLKKYHFTFLGQEKITTPLGEFNTLKIQHQRHQSDKTITLWCASKLQFLPVKIIQDETDKPQFISHINAYKKL